MNITRGKIQTAKKVCIYGTEGIGKSTLAAQFPDPLFIDTEGSTKELDVNRYDKPTSWEMLKEQVKYTINTKPCKTLVIDTVDWAERLCIENLCAKYDKKGIEDFGYGNGYVYEKEDFGRFLDLLEEVIDAGINVVLTAHAIIRKFEQPDEMGSYDRYEMKLGKKTTNLIAPLIKEWADMVLFANYKTYSIAVDKDGKKHKGQGGQRVMYTTHHPCWDAKNRYGLPEEIPMDYNQIRHILEQIPPPAEKPKVSEPEVQLVNKGDFDLIIDPTEFAKEEMEGIPQALKDLMIASDISELEIRKAVSDKGYFPVDMPVRDYPIDFINGVLIGAWEQVKTMIKK